MISAVFTSVHVKNKYQFAYNWGKFSVSNVEQFSSADKFIEAVEKEYFKLRNSADFLTKLSSTLFGNKLYQEDIEFNDIRLEDKYGFSISIIQSIELKRDNTDFSKLSFREMCERIWNFSTRVSLNIQDHYSDLINSKEEVHND